MARSGTKVSTCLRALLFASAGLLCPAAVAEPAIAGLAHVELKVSDAGRSLDFYSSVFGAGSWLQSSDGAYWLAVGGGYLVLRESPDTGLALAAFTVEDFEPQLLRNYLQSQQINVHQFSQTRLSVRDGDSLDSALASAVHPQEALSPIDPGGDGDAIFQPLLLDELHIMVSNLEVDSLFYSRLLGRSGSQQAGALWFDLGQGRLRLTQVPPGQSPGINYLSILVANTDMDEASERVFATGGLIENLLPNGFSFWDPDGVRIVVRTTSLH